MIVWILLIDIFIFINFVTAYPNIASAKPFKTCFHHFGCIDFTEEWFNSTYRPENLPPLDYKFVNTKFLLLNAKPASKIISYDTISTNPETIKITTFENDNQLILLIHDFTSNGYTGWIKHMALEISYMKRYNIISVDWQEGAEPPFVQAISNARVVALEIRNLILTLEKEFDLIISNIHLIGHGVGAHIAGYVGKLMGGRIGRITGLDPTGPYFEGMPSVVHLDYTDASYVEVIHTDGKGSHHQGTMQPFGNIDFYFNNGYNQPGCKNICSPVSLLKVYRNELRQGEAVPNCSHKRSFKYYIQAIKGNIRPTTSCSYIAVPIGSSEYEYSKCALPSNNSDDNITCAGIGLTVDTDLYSKQVYTKLEVNTPPCNPFCINRFETTVDFAKCPEAEPEGNGYFNLTLTDVDGSQFNSTFKKNSTGSSVILLGHRMTYPVWTDNPPIDNAYHMSIMWHFTSPFCFVCRNATCVSRISVTHVRPYANGMDKKMTVAFCPQDKEYAVLYDHQNYEGLVKCKNTFEKNSCRF